MTSLCNAFKDKLDALADTLPRHANFPHVILPPSCEAFPKAVCSQCPQKDNHPTYRRARFKQELETQYSIPEELWTYGQWALETLHRLFYGGVPTARGEGSKYNAEGSLNFADGVPWEVLYVDGNTITCRVPGWEGYSFDRENPGFRLLASHRYIPSDALFYTYSGTWGPPMPGDIVEITDPRSALYSKVLPTVVRVSDINYVTGVVSLTLNMDVSQIMWNADVTQIGGDLLDSVSIKTWRRAGNLARKTYIVPDAKMKVVRRMVVYTADTLPEDGRIQLKNSAGANTRIPPYDAGDPARGVWPNFRVEAVVNGVVQNWGPLLAPGAGRTFVQAVGTGYITWVCLGTTDWKGEETLTDLREGLSEIAIRYFAEATFIEAQETGVNTSWEFHCAGRCKYAREVPGNGNYNMPFGSDTDPGGKRWYCAMRYYPQKTLERVGNEGYDAFQYKETIEWLSPKAPNCLDPTNETLGGPRVFQYNCSQIGTCSHYARIDEAGAGERPFSPLVDGPSVLRGMIMGAPYKLTQLMPGFNAYVWGVPPEGQESILSLLGLLMGLKSRTGYHPNVDFVGLGVNCGPWSVSTNEAGDAYIDVRKGFNWDARISLLQLADVVWNETGTYPGAGGLEGSSGWGTRIHPATGAAITNTDDPLLTLRKHFDGMGLAIQPDTGQILGTGYEWMSWLGSNDVKLYAEAVETGDHMLGKEQIRGDVSVTFLSSNITVKPGFTAGGYIDVLRVINGGRHAVTGGRIQDKGAINISQMQAVRTAEIDQVVSLGDNRYRFVLKNQRRIHSYTVVIPGGGSFDQLVPYEGGDHWWSLPDFLRPSDYHDPEKRLGDGWDRCRIGAAVRFDKDVADIPDFRNMAWTVDGGRPSHPDYIAPDWGRRYVTSRGLMVGGLLRPSENNRRMDMNNDGVIDGDDVDSETGTYGIGVIRTPTAVAASDVTDPAAFFIPVLAQCSFPINSFIKNLRTGEIMQINSWHTDPFRMAVTRGTFGTTASAVMTGDVFELIHVIGVDEFNVLTTPYTRVLGELRPATLAAGEYWTNPITGDFHFSQEDVAAGNKVNLYYAVQGQPDTPDFAYTESFLRIGLPSGYSGSDPDHHRLAHYYSGISTSESGTWVVKDDSTGAVFSSAGSTYTPPKGSYGLIDEGGVAVLYFHADDAGKLIYIEIDTGEANTEGPGDIAYVPGFSTYGRAMDVFEVTCESGILEHVKDSLPGTTVSLLYGAQVFDAVKPGVAAGAHEAELSYTAPAEDVLSQHGMGRIWLSPGAVSAIRALGDKVCIEVGG